MSIFEPSEPETKMVNIGVLMGTEPIESMDIDSSKDHVLPADNLPHHKCTKCTTPITAAQTSFCTDLYSLPLCDACLESVQAIRNQKLHAKLAQTRTQAPTPEPDIPEPNTPAHSNRKCDKCGKEAEVEYEIISSTTRVRKGSICQTKISCLCEPCRALVTREYWKAETAKLMRRFRLKLKS